MMRVVPSKNISIQSFQKDLTDSRTNFRTPMVFFLLSIGRTEEIEQEQAALQIYVVIGYNDPMKPLSKTHFWPDMSGNGNHFYSPELLSLLREAQSMQSGDLVHVFVYRYAFSRALSNEEIAILNEYMRAVTELFPSSPHQFSIMQPSHRQEQEEGYQEGQ